MRKALKQRSLAAHAGDVPAYADADFTFHLAVAKAAKSGALFDVYESFVQTVRGPLVRAVTPEYVRNEDDRLHAALCEAIAKGNAAEARRLAMSHLHKSFQDISSQVGLRSRARGVRRPTSE